MKKLNLEAEDTSASKDSEVILQQEKENTLMEVDNVKDHKKRRSRRRLR